MMNSRSLYLPVRGVRYHLREWGQPGPEPTVFLLHGWGDMSASWQFLADALGVGWHLIAPDWRGFGGSGRGGDGYWFPDYLADLDVLLREFCPDRPVDLVGHSMGGNVACLFAGVRPGRVRRVAALDAFGLPDMAPDGAPDRLERWLSQLERGDAFRTYADVAAFAGRLMADNPRLGSVKADFLARHMTEPASGGVRVTVDPAHRRVNPVPYRRAEALACWRRVVSPVLWVVQSDPAWRRRMGVDDASYKEGCACFRDFHEVMLADCGHNMHHDQPALLAQVLWGFLREAGFV